MSQELLQISIDLLLIFRLSAAFSWGIIYAVFLQFNKVGQFLANERTWLAVALGMGIDLLIAFNADWFTVVGVIAASFVGMLVRSLWNEQNQELNPHSYRLKGYLEDSIAIIIELEQDIMKQLDSGNQSAYLGRYLVKLHKMRDYLGMAREIKR